MKIKLTEDVSYILDILIKNGYEAYIVGGCVRDSLIERQLKDWDITTSAKPEDILRLFEKTIPTGIKHGTVTVVLNKNNYEVTTYRIDGYYSDNRHPDEVIFTSSLKEDLSRRDFTVNSLAYNSINGLVDMFDGISDLHNRLIKCVGDPDKRFNEDALRMLRAIRFACQLDFTIDEETYKAISRNYALLRNVSSERIKDEFCKILLTSKPSRGMKMLLETKLLDYIVPELTESVGFDQKNPHHDKNVFDHIMSVLDNSEENLIVRLGALFHDIGKPRTFSIDKKGIGHFYGHNVVSAQMAEEILKRLKFDNKTIEKVIIIITEHMSAYNNMKNRTLKKFISRVGVDNLEDLFQLQIADSKGHKKDADFSPIIKRREEVKKILESGEPFTVSQLKINGNDLIALGFKPGKYIGVLLNELLEKVMEKPELNNRDSLLKIAREKLENK
ncbi:CCA tRNA nucleotidyltransferase [Clostridium sp. YIM B02515]|uniref:CCA tRNA nucleotidyltransferase n=1 Tax=Clostridium rhizosphaerae TaxID=2803861 RepID=A0ABS1TD19_9CLOT|nr:CCA tRNA nucleotidyltransferase [Clostridium rhizosphaerae]MBL4936682.1 CCA tRNA nucleotidyltransferase [Clostridium rhizosphaerae]